MYTIMRYENNDGDRVDFIGNVDPDGFIATTRLEHTVNPRATRRAKSEAHGSWPTFTYYESMTITLEGSIQAISPSAYNEFVTGIGQITMPNPLVPQRDRTQGTFTIRKSGSTAIWEVPVSVEVPLQTPQEATSPSRTEYHITFMAFRPFYYEPKTNRYFWPT